MSGFTQQKMIEMEARKKGMNKLKREDCGT